MAALSKPLVTAENVTDHEVIEAVKSGLGGIRFYPGTVLWHQPEYLSQFPLGRCDEGDQE